MENSLLRGRGQGKGFTSVIREGVSFEIILYGNLQCFKALRGSKRPRVGKVGSAGGRAEGECFC